VNGYGLSSLIRSFADNFFVKIEFDNINGSFPPGTLIQAGMENFME